MTALPPVADAQTWRTELDALRVREKAATRELARRSPKIKKMWGWGTADVRP